MERGADYGVACASVNGRLHELRPGET